MIEYISITDFQKHRTLATELDRYVTVFTGDTNAGKSTILRAARWVMFNIPPKKGKFIHWDATQACVEVGCDQNVIAREQGKYHNYYVLDGKRYPALDRRVVPVDIATIFNVGVENWHRQHDQFFWFSETPGQVAKNLNSIVNLEVIDLSLQRIKSDLKKARTAEEVSEQRLVEAQQQKESLAWIKDFNRWLQGVEEREMVREKGAQDVTRLEAVLKEMGALQQTLDVAAVGISAGQAVLGKWGVLRDQAEEVGRLQEIVDSLTAFQAIETPPDLSHIEELWNRIDSLRDRYDRLDGLRREMVAVEEMVCSANQELETAARLFARVTKNQCPTCLQPLQIQL